MPNWVEMALVENRKFIQAHLGRPDFPARKSSLLVLWLPSFALEFESKELKFMEDFYGSYQHRASIGSL